MNAAAPGDEATDGAPRSQTADCAPPIADDGNPAKPKGKGKGAKGKKPPRGAAGRAP